MSDLLDCINTKKAVLVCAMAAFLFSATGAAPSAFAGPSIKVTPAKHDLGKINEGDKVSRRFTITNEGNETLVVKDVIPSCGCTTSQIDSKNIGPGESSGVTIVFDSALRPGPFTKQVTILSNDEARPKVDALITGEVVRAPAPRVTLEPSLVRLNKAPPESVVEAWFNVRNDGSKELVVTGVYLKKGVYAVGAPVREKAPVEAFTLAPGGQKPIMLPVKTPAKGFIRLEYQVETNDPRIPMATLIITGEVETPKK
ncbi:MAG: DUF1573 domain-containing protein [Nitrospinae bacterium]|nr:DUF1573 domain-containing protein [Nitrospinota bacterium]